MKKSRQISYVNENFQKNRIAPHVIELTKVDQIHHFFQLYFLVVYSTIRHHIHKRHAAGMKSADFTNFQGSFGGQDEVGSTSNLDIRNLREKLNRIGLRMKNRFSGQIRSIFKINTLSPVRYPESSYPLCTTQCSIKILSRGFWYQKIL